MLTNEDSPGGGGSPWPRQRFICDQHLGALARLLRQLGFDTAWHAGLLEPEMARRCVNEDRVALTRNRQLLQRKSLGPALLVANDQPDEQAVQVLAHFHLADQVCCFSRCSRCGGIIDDVDREQVAHLIPPRTRAWLDTYFRCRDCGQLYWEGTHVQKLRGRLQTIIDRARARAREDTP